MGLSYLPVPTFKHQPNVARYTINGWYGYKLAQVSCVVVSQVDLNESISLLPLKIQVVM